MGAAVEKDGFFVFLGFGGGGGGLGGRDVELGDWAGGFGDGF